MNPAPLSLTARTLYAELRDLAMAMAATENLGPTPGTVVKKRLKGSEYLYFQYLDLDGRKHQAYLGPDNEQTRSIAERVKTRDQTREADLARLDELRAAFVAAGGRTTEHAPMRVLKGFSDAGLLRPGSGVVLVGTHAFIALGNLLGVRWASQLQTQDIDLAGYDGVDLAVDKPKSTPTKIFERLKMGFIPGPALDPRSPSTSFRVRGAELRVDLLTVSRGKPASRPVFVPALNAAAHPLRFLDYLFEGNLQAPLVGKRWLLLSNVPSPERFAFHKLLVSESRGSSEANKAEKDRIQACQLFRVLLDEAPDGLSEAKVDLINRGKGWRERLDRGLERCLRIEPEVIDSIRAL